MTCGALRFVLGPVMALLAFVATANAGARIRIEFEVCGKTRSGPRVIEFHRSQRLLSRQPIVHGGFESPALGGTAVDVHLRLDGRPLVFRDVPASKFQGSWKVGIDRPPFQEENASSVAAAARPRELWFIQFDPPTGDGTRMVVSIPATEPR